MNNRLELVNLAGAFLQIKDFCSSRGCCKGDCVLSDVCYYITAYHNMKLLADDAIDNINDYLHRLARMEEAEE